MRFFGGDPPGASAAVAARRQAVTKADVKEGNEGIGPLAGDAVRAMYGMPSGATAYFGRTATRAASRRGSACRFTARRAVIEILTGYLPAVKYPG